MRPIELLNAFFSHQFGYKNQDALKRVAILSFAFFTIQ